MCLGPLSYAQHPDDSLITSYLLKFCTTYLLEEYKSTHRRKDFARLSSALSNCLQTDCSVLNLLTGSEQIQSSSNNFASGLFKMLLEYAMISFLKCLKDYKILFCIQKLVKDAWPSGYA